MTRELGGRFHAEPISPGQPIHPRRRPRRRAGRRASHPLSTRALSARVRRPCARPSRRACMLHAARARTLTYIAPGTTVLPLPITSRSIAQHPDQSALVTVYLPTYVHTRSPTRVTLMGLGPHTATRRRAHMHSRGGLALRYPSPLGDNAPVHVPNRHTPSNESTNSQSFSPPRARAARVWRRAGRAGERKHLVVGVGCW